MLSRRKFSCSSKLHSSDCIFYFHRPIGSPLGTFRLTLEPAGHRKSYWAVSHPWRDIYKVLDGIDIRFLELAGDFTAWRDLEGWDEVCQRLGKQRSQLESVRFFSGIPGVQQGALLRWTRPYRVEIQYPKDYFALQSLDCPFALSICNGSVMGDLECTALSQVLQRIRRLDLRETPVSSLTAWKILFDAIEASSSLEEVYWEQKISMQTIPDDQFDRTLSYLKGRSSFNTFHRSRITGTTGLKRSENGEIGLDVMASASEVLREWWRSTHRPRIPPASNDNDSTPFLKHPIEKCNCCPKNTSS